MCEIVKYNISLQKKQTRHATLDGITWDCTNLSCKIYNKL